MTSIVVANEKAKENSSKKTEGKWNSKRTDQELEQDINSEGQWSRN
jgi:hypothetical protein